MIAYLNYAEDSGPWVSVLPRCKPVSWAQAMDDIDFAGEKVEMEMVNFMACSPCKGEGSVAIPFFDDYRDEIKNMFDIHKVIKGCSKISLYLQPQPGALARIAFIPMMEQWVKSGDFKEAFERLKEYYNA